MSDFIYGISEIEDEGDYPNFDTYFIDPDFSTTMNLVLVAGSLPDGKIDTEARGYVINESAKERLIALGGDAWTDPIGREITFLVPGADGWVPRSTERVVAVVKDFNYRPLQEEVGPLVMHALPQAFNRAVVSIEPGQTQAVRHHLEEAYASLGAELPFEFYFLDSFLDSLYNNERQLARLFSLFALTALLVSCLGLLGLASIAAEQKKHEMGMRRVLGADGLQLFFLFSREYVGLLAISCVLAIPLALHALGIWLDQFAYRAAVSPVPVVLAILITIVLATVAISYHARRTSNTNPITILRDT